MANLTTFPFLAPISLRRPLVRGHQLVAGPVPDPISWGGGVVRGYRGAVEQGGRGDRQPREIGRAHV